MKKNYNAPEIVAFNAGDILLESGYAVTNGNGNDDILTTSIFD